MKIKLTDCAGQDPATRELFIAAQESEISSVLRRSIARDRLTQAVLGVKKWKLDVETATLDQMLDSEETMNLISALGVGIDFGLGDQVSFPLDHLRYKKVILVLRPDARGRRIQRQIISFLHIYMRPLLEAGHVYTVDVPKRKLTEDLIVERAVNATTRVLKPICAGKTASATLGPY